MQKDRKNGIKKIKKNKEFSKKREKIENNPLRKIQRVIRELNQGKKSFQNMKTKTIT